MLMRRPPPIMTASERPSEPPDALSFSTPRAPASAQFRPSDRNPLPFRRLQLRSSSFNNNNKRAKLMTHVDQMFCLLRRPKTLPSIRLASRAARLQPGALIWAINFNCCRLLFTFNSAPAAPSRVRPRLARLTWRNFLHFITRSGASRGHHRALSSSSNNHNYHNTRAAAARTC